MVMSTTTTTSKDGQEEAVTRLTVMAMVKKGIMLDVMMEMMVKELTFLSLSVCCLLDRVLIILAQHLLAQI
eukprot:761386-Hanusia_phi.AAC.1